MGRRIYEKGNFVYKYVVGEQPSEIDRICSELNIGKIKRTECNRKIIIKDRDEAIEKIENYLKQKNAYKKKKSYNDYMNNYYNKYRGLIYLPSEHFDKPSKWKKENDEDIHYYFMLMAIKDYIKENKKDVYIFSDTF